MFGYRQKNSRLVIVPEEAELLRMAAKMHLAGANPQYYVEGSHEAILDRPGIRELLNLAAQSRMEEILVADLSRISRNTGDLICFKEKLERRHIRLNTPQVPFPEPVGFLSFTWY